MTEITDIIDNGESEVQIATIGKVIGSTTDGKPVEQHFSEDALQKIAESQIDEILVDADHESELGGKTDAKGWLSNLKFVKGKGLFGTIKWTDIGRKLIENRVFRWLSPSWKVNGITKEPMLMTSCALTNKPSQAGRIDPIINAEPQEKNETTENVENNEETETNENFEIEKDITDMTKDEIMALIDERVAEILNSKCNKEEETTVNSAPVEETNVEETNEVVEEVKTEEVETNEEVNNETNEDEVKEETKEEVVEEVIKLETLNSAPVVVETVDAWKTLHGKAFWDYLSKQK